MHVLSVYTDNVRENGNQGLGENNRIGVVPEGRAGGQAERALADANPVSPMNPCIEDLVVLDGVSGLLARMCSLPAGRTRGQSIVFSHQAASSAEYGAHFTTG